MHVHTLRFGLVVVVAIALCLSILSTHGELTQTTVISDVAAATPAQPQDVNVVHFTELQAAVEAAVVKQNKRKSKKKFHNDKQLRGQTPPTKEEEEDMRELPPAALFQDHIFLGHFPAPDMDSVASAIAGAAFFGGTAAMPGPVNTESQFILDRFNMAPPHQLKSIYTGNEPYVLVDHNAASQRAPLLNPEGLSGVLDHHAMSGNSVSQDKPILWDVRAWGSCSTIMAFRYMEYGVPIPTGVAGVLLGGIVSDTLALQGPTTSAADREAFGWLAIQAQVQDVHALATQQFQAKADLTAWTTEAILKSDWKQYSLEMSGGKVVSVAWGTVESVDPFYSAYLKPERLAEFASALVIVRETLNLDAAFLTFVDVTKMRSVMVAASDLAGRVVASKVFGPTTGVLDKFPQSEPVAVVDTSPRVSRKKEFMPLLRTTLESLT